MTQLELVLLLSNSALALGGAWLLRSCAFGEPKAHYVPVRTNTRRRR